MAMGIIMGSKEPIQQVGFAVILLHSTTKLSRQQKKPTGLTVSTLHKSLHANTCATRRLIVSQSRWLDDIQPQFDRVGNGAWVQKIVLLDTLEVR